MQKHKYRGDNILNKVLDLIYPQVCGICGKINTKSLCNKCEINLKKYLAIQIDNYNDFGTYYDKHIYFFQYEGIIRKLLINYKFNEKSYLYRSFVNFLLKQQKVFEIIKTYDIILPVPISKKRYNQRGYNQTELIVREISKRADIKLVTNCLYKVKNNVPQSTLNKDDRIENVKNAYIIKNSKIIKDKRVIILDDIYTTGSTVNECSKLLKQNNVKEILVMTIAKD